MLFSVEQVAGFSLWEILPDRREMARLKLNIEDLNEIVETAIGGRGATELVEGQIHFGVLVRFPLSRRNSIEAIKKIFVSTPTESKAPLSHIARIECIEGPAQISCENNMRRVAVIEASALRFRALLMTAATTEMGLLPMHYSTGPGAKIQRPLAVVVIGGLIIATLLTLFVLPTLYVRINQDQKA